MNDLLITEKVIDDYRICIYYDTDTDCPCTSWDMAACFLFEYNDRYHHRLSNVCNWSEVFGKHGNSNHSLDDALAVLVSDYVEWKDLLNYIKKGKLVGYRMRYDRSENMWHLEWRDNSRYVEIFSVAPSELYTYDHTDEFIENMDREEVVQILNELGKDIFVKEWSTSGYCQGDYVEGVAFCTKERYAKMVNTDTTDWKTKIDTLIDGEVVFIGMWMWGDVKGFVLEKKVPFIKKYKDEERKDEESFEWEEIDSCWGYYMATEELIEEVVSEHNLKEVA